MIALTRRRLLSITANVVSLTAVAGSYLPGLAAAQDEDDDLHGAANQETLATLVRDLFPHDAVPPSVYAEVARALTAQEQGSEGDLELIQAGIRALDAAAGGAWRQLDEPVRLQTLQTATGTPFFNLMLTRSRSLLYLRPEIWQLVGYGGDALRQGGYLTRGFDDIDWLN
jgi:hypothetical protein